MASHYHIQWNTVSKKNVLQNLETIKLSKVSETQKYFTIIQNIYNRQIMEIENIRDDTKNLKQGELQS